MRDVMPHRGPDGHGLFVDGAIGLGHRRLAVIDLEGGRQPLSNEDGRVTVVFNGEIYNFTDLRRALEAGGHRLATRSDTEVIVHAYEDKGTDCVEDFRGMFAFALWDSERQQLLLARDRLGVKPLYYARIGQSLVFGSEIKCLLQAQGVSAEIDPRGLRRYLAYRHSYGEPTLFKGICQLPPGHILVANRSGIGIRRYWDVPTRPDGPERQDVEQAFLSLLDESVRLRMISDVPLGVFLSGGIDSSAVTALMARHTSHVKTFSVGFVPGEENELSWARMVAGHCGAQHQEFVLGPGNFFSLLQKLVWHHDEPLMFPASIPLYLLSRESKSAATVMLAGEGADEILAGYDRNVRAYWQNRAFAHIPFAIRRRLGDLPLPRRASALAGRAGLSDDALISGGLRLAGHADISAACRLPLPAAEQDDQLLIEEVGFNRRQGTFLDRLLYFQLKTYLVSLLMKQDKMSMAASIETRVPFLDHHLVGLAFSLSDSQRVKGRRGKHLLRRVSRGLLPNTVIDRPKKGFPVPIARWFRDNGNPFVEVLLDGDTLRNGLLAADYVRSRVKRFLAGEDLSIELWAMLNLELWRREFVSEAKHRQMIAS
jgi:asparagine synthase (glutamine-hydrolysing)